MTTTTSRCASWSATSPRPSARAAICCSTWARRRTARSRAEQVERLEGLGDWIRRHAEAVYGTVAGLPGRAPLRPQHPLRRPPHPLSDGASTSRAARSAYAACAPRSAGSGCSAPAPGWATGSSAVSHEVAGVLWIDPPAAADLDAHATVLPWNSTASWSCTGVPGAAEDHRRGPGGQLRTWISACVPLVRQWSLRRVQRGLGVGVEAGDDVRLQGAQRGHRPGEVRGDGRRRGWSGTSSRSPTRRR